MASIKIIYDVDRWAYHNRALALKKYAPPDFEVSIVPSHGLGGLNDLAGTVGDEPVDIVFLLDAMLAAPLRKLLERLKWETKLVVSWSVGWPHRISLFHEVLRDADAVVINNRKYWEMVGRLPGTHMIANGVDRDIFNVENPIAMRKPRVLWCGSEHRRALKGYDDYLLPLQAALHDEGIDTDFVVVDSYHANKRTPRQMAKWYNTGMVVVIASETEGTPNIALEGAACGCTLVSTPVGNMPELIRDRGNGFLVERSHVPFLQRVRTACARYPELAGQMQKDIEAWGWAERSQEYFALFKDLLSERSWRGAAYALDKPVDLCDQVTVFVTTAGAPSFNACLECLHRQDCGFRLKIVEYVAPISAALQSMQEACATPYYVHVDEAMLLYPWAVRSLYESLCNSEPNVAAVSAPLFDVHMERLRRGVNGYRCELLRDHPHDRSVSFDGCEAERPQALGHRLVCIDDPGGGTTTESAGAYGLWGAHWTDAAIYERYGTLERSHSRYSEKERDLEDVRPEIMRRVVANRSRLDFFALMGSVAGVIANQADEHSIETRRDDQNIQGFEHLCRFLDEIMPGTKR